MITTQQINAVIRKGLQRFEKPYQVPAEKIQIVFTLAEGKVQYIMCIDQKRTNTVTLKQLIGANVYNPLVESKIKALLEKYSRENSAKAEGLNILAGMKAEDHVYYALRQNEEIIRAIDPGELSN